MDAAPGSSSSTSNDGTSNDALLKALDSASSALQAATTAIGTLKSLISGGAGAAKDGAGAAKDGAGATNGAGAAKGGNAANGAGAAKGGSGYAKGGAGAAKGTDAAKGGAGAANGAGAAKGGAGAAKGGNTANGAGAAKGANGGTTTSAGSATSIDGLLAELMQLLNNAGTALGGTTGAAKGTTGGTTGGAKGTTGGTTGAAKGTTGGTTDATTGGINLANTGLMGAIAGTSSGTPSSTGANLGNTGLLSGNTGIVPPPAASGATGAAAAAAAAAATANPGGQKLAIFSAIDYKNFLLAGSQGGTQPTDQLIDSRFADPTSRFANASNQNFQAAVAGMYANQFKGFALGLDVAFTPGKNIDTIAANLVTAGKTQMTPEAELLSKVAATYRGNLTTGGPNLYNNAALKALLIKWGRTDLANQPSVGSQSGDVQTLGSVIKALNEETDPAIRKAWMQDIFDFAGNTPSSPSGAVPNLPQYQQAVGLVKGGGLDTLLAGYLQGPGIFN